MEFKPGDVVTLKSGGHPLTVAEVHEDTVACLWMGIEGDLFRETLPLSVLELADPDEEEDDEEDDEDEGDEEEDDDEDEEEEDDEEEDDEDKPRKKRA
ncbi:MAG: YodC family protein [Bradyrhizobium sp.]|nr:DUF2158 domain-containing protein [Bradyrhizobium sp.]